MTRNATKTCRRKEKIPTLRLAKKKVKERNRFSSCKLFFYKCDVCQNYHLTSKHPNKFRRFNK